MAMQNEVITTVETLADVARYANRPPGAILRIEDLSEVLPYIKDFETYLHLRLEVNIQSAQRRLWDIISPETTVYLKTQIAKSTLLLQQLELPKEQRDPLAQIEIEGHKHYFKKTRNWRRN